jgi:hypothetical protein
MGESYLAIPLELVISSAVMDVREEQSVEVRYMMMVCKTMLVTRTDKQPGERIRIKRRFLLGLIVQ